MFPACVFMQFLLVYASFKAGCRRYFQQCTNSPSINLNKIIVPFTVRHNNVNALIHKRISFDTWRTKESMTRSLVLVWLYSDKVTLLKSCPSKKDQHIHRKNGNLFMKKKNCSLHKVAQGWATAELLGTFLLLLLIICTEHLGSHWARARSWWLFSIYNTRQISTIIALL